MAKYSKGAQKGVESAMKRMEKGKLRSGRSRKKVTNPKQAIAIGLSEARKKGAKVPKKKSAAKKSAAKKTAVKKKAAPKKKTVAKKAASGRKPLARKSATARKKGRGTSANTATKTTRKVRKAAPKKRTATTSRTTREKTNLRSATAEMETPVAINHVQTEMLQNEDPIRTADQHAFDRFTAKGDPRQKLQLSSKPKNAIKPSGKKPLWT